MLKRLSGSIKSLRHLYDFFYDEKMIVYDLETYVEMMEWHTVDLVWLVLCLWTRIERQYLTKHL